MFLNKNYIFEYIFENVKSNKISKFNCNSSVDWNIWFKIKSFSRHIFLLEQYFLTLSLTYFH